MKGVAIAASLAGLGLVAVSNADGPVAGVGFLLLVGALLFGAKYEHNAFYE